MGIYCNKELFRKFRYSFSADKFNEIKYDERFQDDKRDRMYDLPQQSVSVSVSFVTQHETDLLHHHSHHV